MRSPKGSNNSRMVGSLRRAIDVLLGRAHVLKGEHSTKGLTRDAAGLIKFRSVDGEASQRHLHGNTWMLHKINGVDRLIIAPERNHVQLLTDLSKSWSGKRYLLYVLVHSRLGRHMPARYQSRPNLEHADVEKFGAAFRSYLETDGRHHLWVGSVDSPGVSVVYDHHNLIYAYGDLDTYKAKLIERGFSEGQHVIPEHHAHNFHPANDYYEDKVMGREWAPCPLQPMDSE